MNEIATTTTSSDADRNRQTGRFQPGNRAGVGHGRPRGSRALLNDVFLTDALDLWQRGGKAALERVMMEQPDVFVKVVASILPKQIEAEVSMFADARSFAEAFELAVETIGGDRKALVSRLHKSNPRLIEAAPIDD